MLNKGSIGTWVSLSDPTVAEIAANGPFDFVVIDTEHTPLGLESVVNCLRAIDAGGAQPIVRVPWNDPVRIKRLLDLGPEGLLIPMVNTESEATDAVEATRYPPTGIRGVAGGRAGTYGLTMGEYVEETHENLTRIPQIETAEAVENAEAIAATDGVDALFVGPADLSASLDLFGQWEDEQFLSNVDTIIAAGNAAGIPVGTLVASPQQLSILGDRGFDYLIVGVDTSVLLAGYFELFDSATSVLDIENEV